MFTQFEKSPSDKKETTHWVSLISLSEMAHVPQVFLVYRYQIIEFTV